MLFYCEVCIIRLKQAKTNNHEENNKLVSLTASNRPIYNFNSTPYYRRNFLLGKQPTETIVTYQQNQIPYGHENNRHQRQKSKGNNE